MKKSINLLLITIFLHMIACSEIEIPAKAVDPQNTVSEESPLAVIHSFYSTKSAYLNSSDKTKRIELERELQKCWHKIMSNQDSILSMLLSLSGTNDTGYTLYGKDFIADEFSIALLPDNLHALYLVEAIIQNDYLFNRRCIRVNSNHEMLRNETINFIYSVGNDTFGDRLNILKNYHIENYENYRKEATEYYNEWHRKRQLQNSKDCGKSPLPKNLKWMSFDKLHDGNCDDNWSFRETDPQERKLYRLDFYIGNGCEEISEGN